MLSPRLSSTWPFRSFWTARRDQNPVNVEVFDPAFWPQLRCRQQDSISFNFQLLRKAMLEEPFGPLLIVLFRNVGPKAGQKPRSAPTMIRKRELVKRICPRVPTSRIIAFLLLEVGFLSNL
jgi:hypothetical protein